MPNILTRLLLPTFACFPLASSSQAAPIEVAPLFIFRGTSQTFYPTYQPAFNEVEEISKGMVDPGTQLIHWRVIGLKSGSRPLNGTTFPNVKWEHLEWPSLVWVSVDHNGPFNTSVGLECPQDFIVVSDVDENGRQTGAICKGNSSEPEPECPACPTGPLPDTVGNPIHAGSNVKVEVAVDYRSTGPGGLQYVRTYRSDRGIWEDNFSLRATDMNRKSRVIQSALPIASEPLIGGCYWAFGNSTYTRRCFPLTSSGKLNDLALSRPGRPAIRFGNTRALRLRPR